MDGRTNHSRRAVSRFESNLLEGLSNISQQQRKKCQGKSPLEDFRTVASAPPHASFAPKTKYTNAEGAREHLGISKSKFFRLRNQGYFKPSPVTGLYHLDDLGREARGIRQPSTYEEQASQKFSEDPKTTLHWLQVREGPTQGAKSKKV
jgi:hypothetical protein